jgi:hypothetical protein
MAIVGSIVGAVLSSAIGGAMAGGGGTSGTQAQTMVDPFAPYRGDYAKQLNSLMTNPSSVATLPGYQASLNQGTNTLNRELAATGRNQSGAEQVALSQYGQQFQSQAFNDQFQKLSVLSGASANPASGGMAGVGQNNQNQTSANQFGGGIASAVAPAISSWLTSPSTGAPGGYNANPSGNVTGSTISSGATLSPMGFSGGGSY